MLWLFLEIHNYVTSTLARENKGLRVGDGTVAAPHLWLVANSGHTTVIHKSEYPLNVVAGDELCRLTNITHVCTIRRTSYLRVER